MYESGKLQINEENRAITEKILADQENEIESIMDDIGKRLGEGRTAKICFLNSKNKICLKIYKKPEQISEVDFYLPPSQEQVFLNELQDIETRARVPKVYACFEANNGNSFLMMETLSAMSVDDVLQGREKLPVNFNLASFKKDLLDFVEYIHERGIYHRDMHEGNIMIDRETGQAYVIDFGAAIKFYGDPEPGERGPYHVTKDGQDKIMVSDGAMVSKVVKKISAKLTEVN